MGRTPERVVDPADWTTLAHTPTAPGRSDPEPGQERTGQEPLTRREAIAQFQHSLAVAATRRQAERGAELADAGLAGTAPAWVARLGAVPDAEQQPGERAGWQRRAGIVAAYRELRGIPDLQLSLGAVERPGVAPQTTGIRVEYSGAWTPRSR